MRCSGDRDVPNVDNEKVPSCFMTQKIIQAIRDSGL